MPVSEISDLLTRRSGPRIPRDYLQGYLEYARIVSEGLEDSGRTLLQRLMTEKHTEVYDTNHEEDGFTKSVEDFLEAQGWKPTRARDSGAFSLDFAIADPRTGLYAIGVECDAPRHRLLERARALAAKGAIQGSPLCPQGIIIRLDSFGRSRAVPFEDGG
jgi:primosomal replication protein N''